MGYGPIDDSIVAAYERAMTRRGETVTFQRITGQAPNVTVTSAVVTALVMSYSPAGQILAVEPEGAVTLGDRMVIVLDRDLRQALFDLPVRKNDKVIVRDETLNIESVDPNKRGLAGAVELRAKGAQ